MSYNDLSDADKSVISSLTRQGDYVGADAYEKRALKALNKSQGSLCKDLPRTMNFCVNKACYACGNHECSMRVCEEK